MPGLEGGTEQEKKPATVEYAVYEAEKAAGSDRGIAKALTLVGVVTATDKKLARWAAVEQHAQLKETIERGEAAYLVAVPKKRATPEETKEEKVEKKVRK